MQREFSVSPERSRNMAAIHSKDTKPELLIRKALFARGLRYRLYGKKLPGKPDIVLSKYKAVIFVNGCFWHGHKGCPLFRLPKTRRDYWIPKIEGNIARDKRNITALRAEGRRICIIWECAIRGKYHLDFNSIIDDVINWPNSDKNILEIEGNFLCAT